ncbi:MAG: 16S rRNA (guanine(966)-N(2))-methyltransferase RsmD [Candidatus Methylomirabilia bacterium]
MRGRPVRVIAGELKGQRLRLPQGRRTRPTADQVRIACLDTLAPWLPGSRFLDLYAGAGGVGIEALSRGSAACVFVERGRFAVQALRENLTHLALEGRSRVLGRDVLPTLDLLKREGRPFTLIFLDPPYESPEAEEALGRLADGVLLIPGGVVTLQHLTKRAHPDRVGCLRTFKRRRFGETTLTFFRAGA